MTINQDYKITSRLPHTQLYWRSGKELRNKVLLEFKDRFKRDMISQQGTNWQRARRIQTAGRNCNTFHDRQRWKCFPYHSNTVLLVSKKNPIWTLHLVRPKRAAKYFFCRVLLFSFFRQYCMIQIIDDKLHDTLITK